MRLTPLRSRVWSLGKFFVLMGALGVTFLVFFGVSMRVALWARDVQVPSLVGRTVNEATAALADRDLALRVEENQRPDDKIEVGKVMQQEPGRRRHEPASAHRARLGQFGTQAHDRAATRRSERTRRAKQPAAAGVVVSSVSEFRSPDYPADVVVAQDPAATSRAPEVSMLLNRGELSATYVMPDVIGMDGERAAEALRQPGLSCVDRRHAALPRRAPGTVVRQQPAGGFQRGRELMRSRSR